VDVDVDEVTAVKPSRKGNHTHFGRGLDQLCHSTAIRGDEACRESWRRSGRAQWGSVVEGMVGLGLELGEDLVGVRVVRNLGGGWYAWGRFCELGALLSI